MRPLVVTTFISVDGVMEAPGGEPGYAHAGWVGPFFSPELGEWKEAEQLAADVLLLGRRTYEGFYGAWPGRDGAMADKINHMRKLVVSTTLGSSDWESTTITPDLEAVRSAKAEEGGPILVAGSRTLVTSLLGAGLVDQLNLQVFPIALGSGDRLWPHVISPTALGLLTSTVMPNGVVTLTYRVG